MYVDFGIGPEGKLINRFSPKGYSTTIVPYKRWLHVLNEDAYRATCGESGHPKYCVGQLINGTLRMFGINMITHIPAGFHNDVTFFHVLAGHEEYAGIMMYGADMEYKARKLLVDKGLNPDEYEHYGGFFGSDGAHGYSYFKDKRAVDIPYEGDTYDQEFTGITKEAFEAFQTWVSAYASKTWQSRFKWDDVWKKLKRKGLRKSPKKKGAKACSARK